MLVQKSWRKSIKNINVIPGELQHSLVVMDVNKLTRKRRRKNFNVEQTKTWRLKEEQVREMFQDRMNVLYEESDEQDPWLKYRDSSVKAAKEICGVSKGKPQHGETWWWQQDVQDAIKRKKESFKKWKKEPSEENKRHYQKDKKGAKKAVANAMKSEAEKELVEIGRCKNVIFQKIRMMRKESNDVAGGNCLKDKEGRIVFSDEDRKRVWKEHMEVIMNEENQWDGSVEADKIEGPVQQFVMEEVEKVLGSMKHGKAGGPTGIVKEHLVASHHGKQIILDTANGILNGKDMPNDWRTSTIVPIYKKKGSVMECGSYRGVKLLEHGMKAVERLLEKRLRDIVKIDKMQFGFMPGKGTIDAIYIVRRVQECYLGKKRKLFMCFVDLEKAFDRVPRRVIEWALRKRNAPESLVRAVMSLYKGAKTKVQVGVLY